MARFALFLPPSADAEAVRETARQAEAAGFVGVWASDSPLLWRDPWVTLGALAADTARVTLGTAVTNPVTRHPAVTASATAALADLAPGRAVLGIGVGDSAVRTLGEQPARLAALREAVHDIRTLLAGGEVDYGGRRMRAHAPSSSRVPIFVAASGPKALALAGELADGVIMIAGATPEHIERSLSAVDVGLARSGRTRTDLEIWLGVFTEITHDDREHAARVVKPWAAWSRLVVGSGLDDVGVALGTNAEFENVYPDLIHAEPDWEAGVEAVDGFVSDAAALAYAREFCLVGTPEQCADQVLAAESAGVDGFYLMHRHVYEMPLALVDAVERRLVPALQARAVGSQKAGALSRAASTRSSGAAQRR